MTTLDIIQRLLTITL